MSIEAVNEAPRWHFYFVRFEEANDWLAFDCSSEEASQASYFEPDHYHEWARWCNRWKRLGEPDF